MVGHIGWWDTFFLNGETRWMVRQVGWWDKLERGTD